MAFAARRKRATAAAEVKKATNGMRSYQIVTEPDAFWHNFVETR